jgi:hypothetical protein
MSRIHRTIALLLLLTLAALPVSAVTSTRTNENGRWSVSSLWSALVSLFSGDATDGRCGLDPDGRCALDPGGVCLREGS